MSRDSYPGGAPRPDKDPRRLLALAVMNLTATLGSVLEDNADTEPRASDADAALGYLYLFQSSPNVPGVPAYMAVPAPQGKVLPDDAATIRQVEVVRDRLSEWLETVGSDETRDKSPLREAIKRLSNL